MPTQSLKVIVDTIFNLSQVYNVIVMIKSKKKKIRPYISIHELVSIHEVEVNTWSISIRERVTSCLGKFS